MNGPRLAITIPGNPQTQGSMYCRCHNGHGIGHYKNATALKRYRKTVAALVATAKFPKSERKEPVSVIVRFHMQRPTTHSGTGRNAGTLKTWAPFWHTNSNWDIDKMQRALFDALVDVGVIHDDGQIVKVDASKQYTQEGGEPRTELIVWKVEETTRGVELGT